MNCTNCGGMMVSKGNGRFKCKYCGNEMVDSSFVAPTPPPASAPRNVSAPVTQSIAHSGSDVFEKNIRGVAEITCTYAGSRSAGSGFLVDRNGLLLTNTHVVTNESNGYAPCRNITVRLAGEVVGATVLALGDDRGGHGSGDDLALLRLDRVPSGATVVGIADFADVRIGEAVYVIGNSLGEGTCITAGIVSDKSRQVEGHTLLMTDCASNPGNSGGPIFNEQGLAIGAIVAGIPSAKGMNYAVPANTILRFLRSEGVYIREQQSAW